MNNGFPSSAAAMNGREPFASTPAGSTLVTGRPAEPSAAAIPSGPRRRSGTPNRTSTAAPAVTPAANATTASTGEAVPVTSRTTAASHKVIQASASPRAAEPRRGGDRDRHRGGQKRGTYQRPVGKPRPLAGTGR